jgi:transcriptional regulator
MEISKCIKDARQNNNISQESLAEQLGVSRQTISSWENGKSYPDLVSIIKMSDIFNISLDKMLKEDKKLVNNMQEKMDTVKSNKSIVFTILFAIIIFGGIYLIQTFVDIPKIDNLYLNIGVLIAFIVGVLTYLFSNVYVGKFLNQKTSNKSILKTIIVMLVTVSLFFIFPLIKNFTTVSWQVFLARIGIIVIFALICMFIFKKIDKC